MIAPRRSLLLVGLLAFASCTVDLGAPVHEVSYYDAGGHLVYVDETPPPPKTQVIIGAPPTSQHVWVDGYWARRAGSWYWVDGRWIERPRPGVVWIPGHWEHHPSGYVWVSGYWR